MLNHAHASTMECRYCCCCCCSSAAAAAAAAAEIGFDPAFAGKAVELQMNGILNSTMLAFFPGNGYSYSNFGELITS
jgi:hypothetical protein